MQVILTLGKRGQVTLPASFLHATGLKADDQLIAEITSEGPFLRPIPLPLERYSARRLKELDTSEADLAAVLPPRSA